MSKSRTQTLLALIVLAVGLVVAAVLGLFAYMSLTATPLHPNPQDVPSATRAAPARQWTDAVERGRQLVRAGLTEQNLPGVSVAVGVGRDIVWAEGFGWADLENQVPVTPDTRFRIGTASKALTSAAVGLLLEKGQLKLDEKIQSYVPGFPEKQWPVTLRQLMAHVAGVRNDGGDEENLSTRCEGPLEGLPRFAERQLLFEPGTQYRYSNYGWILVSAAVEAAADEPFFRFMRRQVFEPLGLDDTRADDATEPIRDRANFYFPKFSGDPRYGPQPHRDIDYSCHAGATAFLSTPSDLVRFVMAINSGKLLQPATVQLLQAPQRLASGQETGYGLGWDLETVELSGKQIRVAGYDGELMGGMAVSFMTFPEQGIDVSVASNTAYADTASLALKVAQAFAEQGKSPSRK
ncbi:MAG: beta-lactamase family protein [Acidobacteria bacterium]|nr:beta-lactamase family protein [Acidobacteriota bacterium]